MSGIVALEGAAGDWQVELLYREDERGACWMSMRLPQFEIVSSGDYRSLTEASADLACTVGPAAAIDFLTLVQVDHTSRLWHLNHANPWI